MSDNQVDTIVIGAGVVGLAIARELTQRKRDVIVIEKEDIIPWIDIGQLRHEHIHGICDHSAVFLIFIGLALNMSALNEK